MFSAVIVNRGANQILITGPNGHRNYISCDAKPVTAVVQGNEVHAVLENGHMNVYDLMRGTRLRTVIA